MIAVAHCTLSSSFCSHSAKVSGLTKQFAAADMFCGEAAIGKSFRRAGLPTLALDIGRDVRDVPWLHAETYNPMHALPYTGYFISPRFSSAPVGYHEPKAWRPGLLGNCMLIMEQNEQHLVLIGLHAACLYSLPHMQCACSGYIRQITGEPAGQRAP